jgi:pilus assembly protein CpaD
MKLPTQKRTPAYASPRSNLFKLALVSVAVLSLAACRPSHNGPEVAGWTLLEPSERHPIMVSQEPAVMKVRVSRGSYGLSPAQHSRLSTFLGKYRAGDSGNSKLVIAVPSGSPNEVAAMQVVAEIRHLMSEYGFGQPDVHVEAYHGGSNPEAPIKVSYLRYVAQGPECGNWPTNLAVEPANLAYPNFGCSTQRNLAAMVANPADLIGPRGMTGRPAERRGEVWEKYTKGESTVSAKKEDERVKVKGAN